MKYHHIISTTSYFHKLVSKQLKVSCSLKAQLQAYLDLCKKHLFS